jgi:hypothetical protein
VSDAAAADARGRPARVAFVLGWIGVALAGCGAGAIEPGKGGPPSPVPTATASASASSRAPLPSPRDGDPLWLRARGADAAERARLAVAVGATGLLEGLEDGGQNARTALLALPFADDAEIALGRLGELALRDGAIPREALLEAILAVAGQPRRQREALDPDGVRACGEALLKLAGQSSLPRAERALAVSAARALAEKGYVQASAIPGDLDPK